MSSLADIIDEVRVLIGDDDYTQETYTDTQIISFIKVALKKLSTRVGFSFTISNGDFDSEPNSQESYLIILQTTCLISKRMYSDAVKNSINIKSETGDSVDTTSRLSSYKELVYGENSPCSLLEREIQAFLKVNPAAITSDVIDYAENIWAGTRKKYEVVDYDGQGSDTLWSTPPGNSRKGKSSQDIDSRYLSDE